MILEDGTMTPESVRTDERIFRVKTFDDEIFLCNLRFFHKYDIGKCKSVQHLWNFEFQNIRKIDIIDMLQILH